MFSCARDGLLGFPMAGFRPNHGLNAYSCGTAGIFTPFPHPERMGEKPLALRTLSSVCSIVWLYYIRKNQKVKRRAQHTEYDVALPAFSAGTTVRSHEG